MHMKQRHHAERNVAGRQLISVRDVSGGSQKIGMSQRHAFGSTGGAAGMEDKRDVFVGRKIFGGFHQRFVHRKADVAVAASFAFDDRYRRLRGSSSSFFSATGGND